MREPLRRLARDDWVVGIAAVCRSSTASVPSTASSRAKGLVRAAVVPAGVATASALALHATHADEEPAE